jgi:sugar phosphate isomerase/epimerase
LSGKVIDQEQAKGQQNDGGDATGCVDPANLLMYGKANPIDALDVFGAYVRGVHANDGEYPTDGLHLGVEKPLGQGRVNFPVQACLIAAADMMPPAHLRGGKRKRR